MASHWFGGYVSTGVFWFFVSGGVTVYLLSISVFRAFMPATGARPKQPK